MNMLIPSVLLPSRPKSFYRLALMNFFFVMGILFSSWAIRIPDIKNSLALSDAELGGILFGAPLGQLLAISPAAWLIGRFSSRHAIRGGMCIMPLALVTLSLAPSRLWLFAALAFFGFANNILNISLNAQAVGVEALYGRSIMGTFHGMWSVGGVIGGIVGAIIAPLGVSPLAHFMVIYCYALLTLATMLRSIMPREVGKGNRKENHNPSKIHPDMYLALLGIIAFGSFAIEGAMYDWTAVYFAQILNVQEELVRVGYVACLTAMVIGRLTADSLVNRFNVVFVLQMSGLCVALGLSLALLFPSLAPATFGFALVGFGMASIVPLCFSLAGKSDKFSAQVSISFVASISYFGLLIAPPMIGVLSESLNLRWALSPLALIGVCIVALAAILKRMRGEGLHL